MALFSYLEKLQSKLADEPYDESLIEYGEGQRPEEERLATFSILD